MPEIILQKVSDSHLTGATAQDKELVRKLKIGEALRVNYTKPRNYEFHKKYFALLNLGFDSWEPEEVTHNNIVAQKNFDKFREDITILSGFYDVVIDTNGNAKPKAKSISFGNMSQDDFEGLYSKTIDVLLEQVLHNYADAEEVNTVVERILSFT